MIRQVTAPINAFCQNTSVLKKYYEFTEIQLFNLGLTQIVDVPATTAAFVGTTPGGTSFRRKQQRLPKR